jgi:WD40 repeat protein
MADVFVSYSRRDAEFVTHLAEGLKGRGKDVWLDVQGIRDGERFPEALRRAIESADAFVFVISPDSVASDFCEQEVAHASQLNKRIVPLALRQVPDDAIPEEIRYRNWIPALQDGVVERVAAAVDADLDWDRQHTRLTVKALEWDAAGRDRSFLLRGADLAAAERWMAAGAGKDPGPTELEHDYLIAARRATARRQRALVGASLIVTAIAIGLLVFALISRSQAITARDTATHQARIAKAQALAADSQIQQSVDPERAVLLGMAAVRIAPIPQAMFALRGALDTSLIRYRLPDAGFQRCGAPGYGRAQEAPGVAFDPAGHQLAEGLCDGTVRIAEATDGHVIRKVDVGAPAGQVAYSPDSRLLAAIGAGRIVLIDPATGAVRARGPRVSGATRLTFSPTAPVVASAGASGIVLWNVNTRRTRTLPVPKKFGEPPGGGLAFSPDGRRLAVNLLYSYNTGPLHLGPQILLLDAATGRVLATNKTPAADLAFSPDGREMVIAEGNPASLVQTLPVLDARTLRARRIFRLSNPGVGSVAFSPDGSAIAYGSGVGSAAVVSAATGRVIASFSGPRGDIGQVSFSPDGRLLASASQDGTARVWLARAQSASTGVDVPILVNLLVEGLVAVPGGFEIALLDRAGAVVLRRWSDRGAAEGRPLQLAPNCDGCGVFITPDGRIAGSAPGVPQQVRIRMFDVPRRRSIAELPPTPAPQGFFGALSPSGNQIAETIFATRSKQEFDLALVDARTGRLRRMARTTCAAGFVSAFSLNDGLVAAASNCGTERYVWNLASGRRIVLPPINGQINSLAFRPDGRRIAIGSSTGTVTIESTTTGRVVTALRGHTAPVNAVSFSPDGTFLASASGDRTVRIWDARSFGLLRIIHHPYQVVGAVFTPDSRRILTYDRAGLVRLFDACTACRNPRALLAAARARVTRALTPAERLTFGVQ